MSAYVTQTAVAYQGSYWPNVPPVLAPSGFYWYDYGPVGRGMNYYRAIPIGKRPSPEDQAATLVKHRAIFDRGVPAGLEKALNEHGLLLPDSTAMTFVSKLVAYSAVTIVIGFIWVALGFKRTK